MVKYSINVAGRLITFDEPKVIGIINVTPDSFYAQSRKESIADIVSAAGDMLVAGASILDIGGMSTRPGAEEISPKEEADRVIPAIENILIQYPQAIISIDTYRSLTASLALDAGAHIVNDISGGDADNKMYEIVAQHNVPYICMHMQGTPQNMQEKPLYENVVLDIFKNLQQKIVRCREAGIKDVIVDVGFGFGKTIEHNFELLKNLKYFQQLDCPVLAGLSRKSMLYKSLNIDAADSLNATSVAHMIALQKGANILRVHDVKEAVECIKVWGLSN